MPFEPTVKESNGQFYVYFNYGYSYEEMTPSEAERYAKRILDMAKDARSQQAQKNVKPFWRQP